MKQETSSLRRRRRVVRHERSRVQGTARRPRLSVFRSKKHLVLQLVDDEASRTLAAVSDRQLSTAATDGRSPGEARAFVLGKLLAEKARGAGVTAAVFDRSGYAYHGRVKAIADGARAGGLVF
jgi:large subunit ribosomal protein L18